MVDRPRGGEKGGLVKSMWDRGGAFHVERSFQELYFQNDPK